VRRIAAIDVYNNDTMKQADVKILLRPGTDGAFACGVMHVLFREGYADRAYMERYTDRPAELEAHLATRTPEWASSISGVPVGRNRGLRSPGRSDKARHSSVSATASHAAATARRRCMRALCIPAVTGAAIRRRWRVFNNYAIWKFNESIIEGHDAIDAKIRWLDQSQIGRILTGDAVALKVGSPCQGDADPEHQPDDGGA